MNEAKCVIPRREIPEYLRDIDQECSDLATTTDALTKEQFLASQMHVSAAERNITIIGEAMNQMFLFHPTIEPNINLARDIIRFSHRLMYEYDEVDSHEVWEFMTTTVPNLRKRIVELSQNPDKWVAKLRR